MDTKTKNELKQAIYKKMADLKLTWCFDRKEWAQFPVSARTIYSICDKDSFNFSTKTLTKVCDFLGLKYTIDGSVLKITDDEL